MVVTKCWKRRETVFFSGHNHISCLCYVEVFVVFLTCFLLVSLGCTCRGTLRARPPNPPRSSDLRACLSSHQVLENKDKGQARKIRLKFWSSEDDQFWISGRPHKLSGCPEDKDIS